ncbi:Predicted arabinose efflux permease, MFS family [Rhizobiales bacterium GAS188]|nr:Predicted arabinose efflux permease, MFS family [Rhizobiales bacterium GAS188]
MTTSTNFASRDIGAGGVDSSYAWLRLGTCVVISTIGNVGLWSYVVALPAVQADFGVTRAAASFPYTLTMLGFGFGGVLMGRLTDRFGVMLPIMIGAVSLGLGYLACALAPTLWLFALAQGVLGLLGCSALFGPLMADVSHWFARRRGTAVAIAAAGNYVSGAIWPPIEQYFIDSIGWRHTYIGIGIFCVVTMLPLALVLRRPAPLHEAQSPAQARSMERPLGMSPNTLQVLLGIAGVGCCVAMSMPQVHLVAYCADLGYGPAVGAEMLAMMLGLGIISRVGSGLVADRIGALATLLIGSAFQGAALILYTGFDGMYSLYAISALFGLVQGGIVPCYAIIVRDYFPPREAGTRVSIAIMATVLGMALGGWMNGLIFDLTGSYRAAFANGVAWNVLNAAIALWLLLRSGGWRARQPALGVTA